MRPGEKKSGNIKKRNEGRRGHKGSNKRVMRRF